MEEYLKLIAEYDSRLELPGEPDCENLWLMSRNILPLVLRGIVNGFPSEDTASALMMPLLVAYQMGKESAGAK